MSDHYVRREPSGWRVKVSLGLPSDYPDYAEDVEEAWRLWRADAAVQFTAALQEVCETALKEIRNGQRGESS